MVTVLAAIATAVVSVTGAYLVARAQYRHKLAEARSVRRRDVYMRALRSLLDLRSYFHAAGHQIRVGELSTVPEHPSEPLPAFEAEMLLDASETVRTLVKQFDSIFTRFVGRLGEIAADDKNDPNRPPVEAHVDQAYDEVVRPFVESLAEAMRRELE